MKRLARKSCSLLFVCAVALSIYGVWLEPKWVQVTDLIIESEGLNKALKGRIGVQLSDLHMRQIGATERKVLKILERIQPDFIFLTGDLIQWNGEVEPALKFLHKLNAKVGVWGVMGDYDYSRSRTSCLFCHERGSGKPTKRHGVHFLRDNVERVSLPGGDFWIGGMEGVEGKSFASMKNSEPQKIEHRPDILLVHDPMLFDSIDSSPSLLVLAGDTHGGQIALPSWVWRLIGYVKVARYGQGLFREGRKEMYVSRGMGTSHTPIRIMRRPEVVVIHFE